jgi:hypothetical protein
MGKGWSRRNAAIRLVAGTAVALGAGPAWAEGSIEVADDEVFFDHRTGNFSSNMTAAAGEPSKIALVAKASSEVTLFYWEKADGGCGDAVPAVAIKRAAAPTGADVGGRQKYITKLGPLRYGREYCVSARVISRVALTSDEKVQVDQALDAALVDALNRPGETVDGCAGSVPAQIKTCLIGHFFEKQLGWDERKLKVVLPGTDEVISAGKAFETLANANVRLRDGLARALQEGTNEARGRDTARRVLDGLTAAAVWLGKDELALDPLAWLEPKEFAKTVRDKELAKQFTDKVLNDKVAFVDLVWKTRVKLAQPGKRRSLAKGAEKTFMAFLEHEGTTPKVIVAKRDHYGSLARDGATMGAADLVKRATDEAKRLPSAEELSKMPGFAEDKKEHMALASLAADLDNLKAAAEAWKAGVDARTKALKELPGWTGFKESMRSVTRVEKVPTSVRNLPGFEDRFSFYVTADLGVAGLLLPGDDTRGDATPFFGLAFYFAPLDKDVPLDGFEPGRRLSLNAGISLTEPSGGGDLGVTGLLGDQAVLVGGGIRLTDYLRLGAGSVLYRQESPNPLSDQVKVRAGAYASLSLDIDVIGVVKGWYDVATD